MGEFAIRPATDGDVAYLEVMIAASARALGRGFYSDAEIEAAVAHVFGVDRMLVTDATYYVAETKLGIAGCGGWSARRTLFGADRCAHRDDGLLDPMADPARIRAFFVAPGQARAGVGTALLARCEAAAVTAGFTNASLLATLSGVPFYEANGYLAAPAMTFDLASTMVSFVPMAKSLLRESNVAELHC